MAQDPNRPNRFQTASGLQIGQPGATGNAPPPGAPHEVAQPIEQMTVGYAVTDPETGQTTVISAAGMARENEKSLEPIKFDETRPPLPVGPRQPVQAASSRPQIQRPPVQAAAQTSAHGGAPRILDAHGQVYAPPTTPKSPNVAEKSEIPPEIDPPAGDPAAATPEGRRFFLAGRVQRGKPATTAEIEAAPRPPRIKMAPPAPPVDPKAVIPASAKVVQAPKGVQPAGSTGAALSKAVAERQNQASRRGDPGRPAASNTDSPSRGQPTRSADPQKQITGGFGDSVAAQYFPLDGNELLDVVWKLMDDLAKRLQNDGRFMVSMCYPRVAVRLDLTVEGYAADQGFTVTKVGPPHERTPLDLAQSMAGVDDVVFVLRTQRREFNDQGESESPPNALRAEVGRPIPHKQVVEGLSGRQIADVGISHYEPSKG